MEQLLELPVPIRNLSGRPLNMIASAPGVMELSKYGSYVPGSPSEQYRGYVSNESLELLPLRPVRANSRVEGPQGTMSGPGFISDNMGIPEFFGDYEKYFLPANIPTDGNLENLDWRTLNKVLIKKLNVRKNRTESGFDVDTSSGKYKDDILKTAATLYGKLQAEIYYPQLAGQIKVRAAGIARQGVEKGLAFAKGLASVLSDFEHNRQ
jgi:hypothetical protein